jgi:hypothetical protein
LYFPVHGENYNTLAKQDCRWSVAPSESAASVIT